MFGLRQDVLDHLCSGPKIKHHAQLVELGIVLLGRSGSLQLGHALKVVSKPIEWYCTKGRSLF
jgi:hypothetical protein